MSIYYAPGCGFKEYKFDLIEKLAQFLKSQNKIDGLYLSCCHIVPDPNKHFTIVNSCAGCDHRYRNAYPNVDTISLWEVLLETDFNYPDYNGAVMTIQDACPTRNQPRQHEALRELLRRMNICVIEPENNRNKGKCCGSVFYNNGLEPQRVLELCKERVAEFPCKDIVVHCTGCARYLNLGGGHARHMIDLLFNEETTIPPKPIYD